MTHTVSQSGRSCQQQQQQQHNDLCNGNHNHNYYYHHNPRKHCFACHRQTNLLLQPNPSPCRKYLPTWSRWGYKILQCRRRFAVVDSHVALTLYYCIVLLYSWVWCCLWQACVWRCPWRCCPNNCWCPWVSRRPPKRKKWHWKRDSFVPGPFINSFPFVPLKPLRMAATIRKTTSTNRPCGSATIRACSMSLSSWLPTYDSVDPTNDPSRLSM